MTVAVPIQQMRARHAARENIVEFLFAGPFEFDVPAGAEESVLLPWEQVDQIVAATVGSGHQIGSAIKVPQLGTKRGVASALDAGDVGRGNRLIEALRLGVGRPSICSLVSVNEQLPMPGANEHVDFAVAVDVRERGVQTAVLRAVQDHLR